VRPDLKRSAAIAGDLLAALGKRRDVAGRGRNENADIDLAVAWMRAYDATAIVLTEAQHLTPLLLRQVVSLAARTGVPLWLLHRAPRTDLFFSALTRHQAHEMKLRDVPKAVVRLTPAPVRETFGIDLPAAPFHQFLTTCRAALTASSHRQLITRHTTTARACGEVLDRDGTDIDVVARLVERLLNPAPCDDVLVTDIRALQLACWHRDLYLKTDIAALLASPERQLTDPVTVDHALTAYRQPHRAISVALANRQVGVTDTRAIRVRDAHATHITTRSGDRIELLEHTARALHAQLLLRNAAADAPLLDLSDRAISLALNEANEDLGIRVHGRRAERHVHPRRWLTSLGLTVQELR
jgi:hypothetical protein